MLLLAEQIKKIYFNKKEKSLYINNVKKIGLINIIEYVKKVNKENINSENVHNTCTWSRLRIQSIQNRFKIIEFINNKKEQIRESVRNKEVIAYLADILVILNNNGLLNKNNVE